MDRRYANMTEQERREEIARRNQAEERERYARDRMEPAGYGSGVAHGWPYMPHPYAGVGFGLERPPADVRRRERAQGGNQPEPEHRRSFAERASDEVASWLGDIDAELRREADHRGHGPKGYTRSDARIEEDAHDRLTADPYLDAREITVGVKDREITLDGTVSSRRAKRHAEDCADSVSGVTHVQNNLRVRAA